MRGKRACPVREGADENVPQGNASAAYFTTSCKRQETVPVGNRKRVP